MNSFLKVVLSLVMAMYATIAFAGGDKILGIYKVVEQGDESKVEFYKKPDGNYEARIIWLKNPNNEDGTRKMDIKNPDKSKRLIHADRIVLIESVSYSAAENRWDDGRIYNPSKGKSYKATLSFDDAKTLRIKETQLGYSRSTVWIKLY